MTMGFGRAFLLPQMKTYIRKVNQHFHRRNSPKISQISSLNSWRATTKVDETHLRGLI